MAVIAPPPSPPPSGFRDDLLNCLLIGGLVTLMVAAVFVPQYLKPSEPHALDFWTASAARYSSLWRQSFGSSRGSSRQLVEHIADDFPSH